MKKFILLFLILAIILTAFFLLMVKAKKEGVAAKHSQFNLSKAEKCILKIDDEDYTITLTKYDPPYFHTKLLDKKDKADYSTPEGTILALWSAVGRDKNWYLSLFDDGAREALLKRDQKTGGKILEEYNKGKPLPDPKKTGNYSKLIYKMNIKINNKEYVIIQEKRSYEGKEEFYPSYMVFVKEEGLWKRSSGLSKHPIVALTQKEYEEVKEILNEGSWSLE